MKVITKDMDTEANRLWKDFIIPRKLLLASATRSSAILTLPTEILIKIFDSADLIDQPAFAFACKYLLQVSSLVVFKMSKFVGDTVSCHEHEMIQLLKRVRPRTPTGRRRKTSRVCIDCIKYRPTKESHWEKKFCLLEAAHRRAAVCNWKNGYNAQCPECWYLDRLRPYPSQDYWKRAT